jgi:methionine-rich copper-binding protein CopC
MISHAATRGLVLAVTLSAAVAAYAHAHLARANPAAGAIVASAPSEVTLAFTQKLEPKFSTVVVRDAGGKQVDKGDPHVDEVDPSLLKVSLPTLAAGRYKVEWRVTSVDTHASKGDYVFRVGK